MRWIAAAGVVTVCLFGLAGTASGAGLAKVVPDGYLDSDPSFLTSPPGDPRLFIAERGDGTSERAQVRVVEGTTPIAEPFLTIDNVDVISERGLMSLAFAPDYSDSGLLYVFYTAAGADQLDPAGQAGDIRIVEYAVSASDPNRADPDSARLVMRVRHSAGNHNGGWMAFGPDGHLYLAIGDNASAANAQTLANLLGKVLRIDPADPPGPDAYSVPPDNPFAGTPGARPEIWTYGLRNPYRASFAPDGRLTIGDVGAGTWEEVNAGDLKGANLGWPTCEGFCSPSNPAFTDPVFAYNHNGNVDGFGGGCAVIGGHVVEDPGLAGLTGRYVFADLCDGEIRSIDLDASGGDFRLTGLDTFGSPIAFGQDSLGCSYVLTTGAVFRIVSDGGTAACPIPPDPPVDVTYRSFIPRQATIARRVVVGAQCSIACEASANGVLRISRNRYRRQPGMLRLQTPLADLAAGARRNLVFQIPLNRVKAIKRAARNGSRITLFAKVSMTGSDGSGGTGSSTMRLVSPTRR